MSLTVSVLTPSYQQIEWIGDCIGSVAAQTRPCLEHVVADGGSSDGTVELLAACDTPGLRYWSAPDHGQADALNQLYDATSGDVLAWVNSDDMLADRRALAWVLETFEARPQVDVVFGDAIVVDGRGRFVQYLRAPTLTLERLQVYNFLVQPAVFIRRRAIERLETFVDATLDYVFDRDLWFRLLASGARFERVPRPLAADRHRAGRKVLDEQLDVELRAVDPRHGARSFDRSSPGARRRRILNRIEGVLAAASAGRRVEPVPGLNLATAGWRTYAQLARPWSAAIE